MDMPRPGSTSRDTGLPPGVEVGPTRPAVLRLSDRSLVPAVAGALMFWLAARLDPDGARLVLGIGCPRWWCVGWAVLVWYMLAERAASSGHAA